MLPGTFCMEVFTREAQQRNCGGGYAKTVDISAHIALRETRWDDAMLRVSSNSSTTSSRDSPDDYSYRFKRRAPTYRGGDALRTSPEIPWRQRNLLYLICLQKGVSDRRPRVANGLARQAISIFTNLSVRA